MVNVDDAALLEDEVFEIKDEVVEFESNSEPTVAPKPSGEPVEKKLVSPRVMPPSLIRAPSPPVHEE